MPMLSMVRAMLNVLATSATFGTLCGCAALVPNAGSISVTPFENEFVRKSASPATASPAQIRDAAADFGELIKRQTLEADGAVWASNDATFVGVLLTVAGFSRPSHGIGLRNGGAALAALSIALEKYLGTDAANAAFKTSFEQTHCILKEIAAVPDEIDDELTAFVRLTRKSIETDGKTSSQVADLQKEILAAEEVRNTWRRDIYNSLTAVRWQLAQSLLSQKPSVPPLSDFSTTFAKFKQAVPTASQSSIGTDKVAAASVKKDLKESLQAKLDALSKLSQDSPLRTDSERAITSVVRQFLSIQALESDPDLLARDVNQLKLLSAALSICTK